MGIAFPTRTLIARSANLCFEGGVRESKSLYHAVMENLLLAAAIDRKQSDRVSFFCNAAKSPRKISFRGSHDARKYFDFKHHHLFLVAVNNNDNLHGIPVGMEDGCA